MRRDQRLADHLAAEHALPADLRAQASEQIHLELLEIEDGEQHFQRAAHGRTFRDRSLGFSSFTEAAERGIACRWLEARATGPDRFDVAIAGGGFAGRALALALAKLAPQGFRIALIDTETAQASGADDARALALSAATKNLLAALDLWAAACAVGASRSRRSRSPTARSNAALRPHFLGFDDRAQA